MSIQKIKVLLVDDQPLVLQILSKGLEQDPFIQVVGTATDGIIALSKVKLLNPDVIVLDMEMPNMNGLQFLHKQMPLNPIPTIVLSSVTSKDSQITLDAFDAGAVDFISKPAGGPNALFDLLKQLWVKVKVAATKDVSYLKNKVVIQPKHQAYSSVVLDRNSKTDQVILGMGIFEVTNDPTKILKIFALGSCIGLALFCRKPEVVALAHIVLPTSTNDLEKAKLVPGYFADTAIKSILDKMQNMGCNIKDINAKLAGGAVTRVAIGDFFGIGQRNHLASKAGLLKNGIKIVAEEVGGDISRTVFVQLGSDKFNLHHPEKGHWSI
ncbi:MAG: response regulator [Candidatus Kapabacteria bacterium]|nr:response regulator [Candidatus Kapabacteria bacterium]